MQISSLVSILYAALNSFNEEQGASNSAKDSSEEFHMKANGNYVTFHDNHNPAFLCAAIKSGYRSFIQQSSSYAGYNAFEISNKEGFTLSVVDSGLVDGLYNITYSSSSPNLLFKTDDDNNIIPYINEEFNSDFYFQYSNVGGSCPQAIYVSNFYSTTLDWLSQTNVEFDD